MKKILEYWQDINCVGCWCFDTNTRNVWEEKYFDNGGMTIHIFGRDEDLPDKLKHLLDKTKEE
jgi:hypothetical protein